MNNLFVSYDISLALKEIGFDEKCIGYFNHRKEFWWMTMGVSNSDAKQALPDGTVAAPLYDQVIDWLVKEHEMLPVVSKAASGSWHWRIQLLYAIGNEEEKIKGYSNFTSSGGRKEALNAAILKAIELIKQKK